MQIFVCFGRWIYCRRCYQYNILLRHHHSHCILLLLYLLPVLPLWYTRCCGRHPTALSTVRIKSCLYDDDAASTNSSAGQLQSATSRLHPVSFGTQSASSALPRPLTTFNSASPPTRRNSIRSDACCCQCCPTGKELTHCTRQPRTPAFLWTLWNKKLLSSKT